MPELPFPPDLDQLRRQARELLRAAAQGESDALARLHAVSDRVVLSAAQLAVAREYGFWGVPRRKARGGSPAPSPWVRTRRPPLRSAPIFWSRPKNAGRSAVPPLSRPPGESCSPS